MFLVDVVTPAELPIEMSAFKTQQHRWTKGSIQTCKKLLPRIWTSRLPLWIKAEATIHLTSNFTYLLLALLCVLLQPPNRAVRCRWLGKGLPYRYTRFWPPILLPPPLFTWLLNES